MAYQRSSLRLLLHSRLHTHRLLVRHHSTAHYYMCSSTALFPPQNHRRPFFFPSKSSLHVPIYPLSPSPPHQVPTLSLPLPLHPSTFLPLSTSPPLHSSLPLLLYPSKFLPRLSLSTPPPAFHLSSSSLYLLRSHTTFPPSLIRSPPSLCLYRHHITR